MEAGGSSMDSGGKFIYLEKILYMIIRLYSFSLEFNIKFIRQNSSYMQVFSKIFYIQLFFTKIIHQLLFNRKFNFIFLKG